MNSVCKIHGGKSYLASFILQHFPKDYENRIYIEPCGGMASVLFKKKPSKQEYYNDINPKTVNLMNVIQNNLEPFVKHLGAIAYTKEEFAYYRDDFEPLSSVDMAVKTYVVSRMSRGGLGKDFSYATRLRGGRNESLNAWFNSIDRLPEYSVRLQGVKLSRYDVIDLLLDLWAFKDERLLIYIDPPYCPSTRTTPNAYEYEMMIEQHKELADTLNSMTGWKDCKIIISGYRSDEYDEWFQGWDKVHKVMPNHSSQSKTKQKRIETLWIS